MFRDYFSNIKHTLFKKWLLNEKARLIERFMYHADSLEQAENLLKTQVLRRMMQPTLVERPEFGRILVLSPHMDDDIIGCGGSLLKAVDSGAKARVVYITDTVSKKLDQEDRTALHRAKCEEAREVWRSLKGEEPVFMDLPCRGIELNHDNAAKLAKEINDYRPDCLMVPFFLEQPEDHRNTNALLMLAHESGLLPEVEIWAYQVTCTVAANLAVDITGREPEKNKLIRMFKTQNKSFDYAHMARGQAAFNSIYVKRLNDPEPFVELFFAASLEQYCEMLARFFKPRAGASAQSETRSHQESGGPV